MWPLSPQSDPEPVLPPPGGLTRTRLWGGSRWTSALDREASDIATLPVATFTPEHSVH